MNLYEYMSKTYDDYDTYDTEYDVCVTVCCGEYTKDDSYERFCKEIMKKVSVVEIHKDYLVCNWCELIKNNMDKFKAFMEKHWVRQYNDAHDFIYQWINEINLYIAGYTYDEVYDEMCELLNTITDAE